EGTQVSLVALALALAAQWRAWGLRPDAVVGHSVGEIAAAAIAGVLSREDALALAARRGALMASAPAGGMVAIAASPDAVARHLSADTWLAAINGPRQTVVAGTASALAELETSLGAVDIAT